MATLTWLNGVVDGVIGRFRGARSAPLAGAELHALDAALSRAMAEGRDEDAFTLLMRLTGDGGPARGSALHHYRLGSFLAAARPAAADAILRAVAQFEAAAQGLTPETLTPETLTIAAIADGIDLMPGLSGRLPPPPTWTGAEAIDWREARAPDSDAEAGRRPLAAFAADPIYANRFIDDALAALRRHAGAKQPVHLHLVNGDAPTAARLAKLAAADPAFGWSQQRLNPAAVRLRYETELTSYRREPILHQCARFLVAPTLMARYAGPLLLLDIGLTLERDWSSLWRALAGADLGLVENPAGRFDFATRFPAGVVAVNDSPGGRRFLDLIARYLVRALYRSGAAPLMDQVALHACFYALRADAELERVRLLPADTLNLARRPPSPRGATLFHSDYLSLATGPSG